jgi:hypothetical protein
MDVNLSESEVHFLRKLLEPYVEYYGLLARSSYCSGFNRKKSEDLRKLNAKLEENSAIKESKKTD